MKYKSLLAGAAMFAALVAVGSAKSWDIVVDSAARAGALELPAGHYIVKLVGNQALFTAADSGRGYSVPVKVETAAQKYDGTAVENTNQGKTEIIESIELGGTATKIEFGEVSPVVATH